MQSDDLGLVPVAWQWRMRVRETPAHEFGAWGDWRDGRSNMSDMANRFAEYEERALFDAAAIERLVAERDEARSEVARYWTSADLTPWVNLAEEKGLGHFGKKLKGMFNRAMTAEGASRAYAEALRQIADLDAVESALDPEWTITRARQALGDTL